MKNKISGIYCIENIVNNKKYIGKSIDIKSRWIEHKSMLRGNYHKNSYLQNAWNKYGENNFKFYIIKECRENKLNKLEIKFIKLMNAHFSLGGYNITWGGEEPPMLGRKHSKETILKMILNRGVILSGKEHPLFGIKFSQEIKDKMSKNHANVSGKNNPNYGRVSKRNGSSSIYLGVSIEKSYKKKMWRATFCRKHIGDFESEIDAAKEFDKMSWKRFHDLNKLNFPEDYK